MSAYVVTVLGCLLIGTLFAMAGSLLMASLDVRTPLGVSLRYACWMAVAVLVAGKALALTA